jgi:hypothetical protein
LNDRKPVVSRENVVTTIGLGETRFPRLGPDIDWSIFGGEEKNGDAASVSAHDAQFLAAVFTYFRRPTAESNALGELRPSLTGTEERLVVSMVSREHQHRPNAGARIRRAGKMYRQLFVPNNIVVCVMLKFSH